MRSVRLAPALEQRLTEVARQLKTSESEVIRAALERYLEALGGLPTDTPLCRVSSKLCRGVVVEGRRYRGLTRIIQT